MSGHTPWSGTRRRRALATEPHTVTEWGIAHDGGIRIFGSGDEAEYLARTLATDYQQARQGGVVLRRTVTYSPWQEST